MSCQKVLVIILMSIYTFCLSGITLMPGSLQQSILSEYNIPNYKFALLYSLPSWASIFDIFHGYIIERYWGLRKATLIYNMIVALGVVLMVAGNLTNPLSYPLFLTGRLIFGFGGNPLLLCLNGYLLHWFAGSKWFNISYAIPESIFWLGSSAIYFVSVHLLSYTSLHYTTFKALGITIVSETIVIGGFMILVMTTAAFLYKEKDGDRKPIQEDSTDSVVSTRKTLKPLDYVKFPTIFWVFAATAFLFYIPTMSFISFSQGYFQQTYNVSVSYANTLSGIIGLVTFALSPPWGFIMDRIGHNLTLMTAALCFNVTAHLLFTFSNCNPLIPAILLSIAQGMASTFWTLWSYVVHEHQQLIAYGIAQGGLMASTALGSLVGGFLIDKYGYAGFEHYMLGIALSGLPGLVLIWIVDSKRGFLLNMTPEKKQEQMAFLFGKKKVEEQNDSLGKEVWKITENENKQIIQSDHNSLNSYGSATDNLKQ